MIGQEVLPVVELVQAFEEWRRELKRMVDKSTTLPPTTIQGQLAHPIKTQRIARLDTMTTTQAAQCTSYSDFSVPFFHPPHSVVLLARRKDDEVLQPPDGRGYAPVCPGLYARGSRWYVLVGIEKRGEERGRGPCLHMCMRAGGLVCVGNGGARLLGAPFLCVTPCPRLSL